MPDNKKAVVRLTKKYGLGVFAKTKIFKGEVIAAFDGPIFTYDYEYWNDDLLNHVIQFEARKWRDANGIARLINHSCEPNCGVKSLFKIVAMRDIARGEHITWDYEMTEKNEQWRMRCHCGSSLCRKWIGNHKNMPREIREKYRGYISRWLAKARRK